LVYANPRELVKLLILPLKEESMRKDSDTGKNGKSKLNIITKHNNTETVKNVATNFLQIVDQIENPRTRPCDYPLNEILLVSVVAVLCGSESYQDIATFGRAQQDWFKQFVPLENGLPAHDTYRRVLMLLKPEAMNEAYNAMFQGLHIGPSGTHIAIDGKKSRGCYNIKGQSLLNMVSAWNTENGVSLGQIATKNDEGKEVGEFNAIPKLVDQLDIQGKLVTIDAGGCYAEITGSIIDGGGDYAITLKENQPTLHKITEAIFKEHEQKNFAGVASYRETNHGHGREEERTYYTVPLPQDDPRLEKWSGLSTLVMGRFRRSVLGGKETEFVRYYISSLPSDQVKRLGQSLRRHWGIENGLHWVLDVSFGEDGNRTRQGNGAENLSILRRMALGILNQVKGKKTIPNVKFRAAVDPEFRTTILEKFLMR
jgi:predicted transposase YbfD/YdcC